MFLILLLVWLSWTCYLTFKIPWIYLQVDYDFEYYKLEMAADVQLLTLSEGKSNILPSDLVVPFRPSSVPTVNAGAEETESWRWYLATVRSLPQSTEPETYQVKHPLLYSLSSNGTNPKPWYNCIVLKTLNMIAKYACLTNYTTLHDMVNEL